MPAAEVKFSSTLVKSDPRNSPVLILGQLHNLQKVAFNGLKTKLEPRVTEEDFNAALGSLHPTPTDTVSLHLNVAYLSALPTKCSRHNAPSRSHAIAKIVKNTAPNVDQYIVMVCESSDVLASACAIGRAFPLYSRKGKAAFGSVSGLPHSTFTVTVEFLLVDGGDSQCALSAEDLQCLTDIVFGVRLAAKIVDTPCSEMHVDAFLKQIDAVGELLDIKPYIIRGQELEKRGFGGLWGVGKAAERLPALAVISHTPEGAKETIAWVGKGIVFDTGGLSMKSKTSMVGMKQDCGGAAGILGAFYAIVKQGFRENLHAVFCLAENAVGPNATRPDDIVTLYSGRTVEINNTDAEGRLVVGDGVAYAQKDLQANVILDMCTLTGAQGIATGKFHAGLVTNSDEWDCACVKAGKSSGDLVHPLPYCPELHFSEFSSTLADMKNSASDRSNALASCAALFIAAQIGFEFPGSWIHVDMASPVSSGERATGYGVALLAALFGHSSNSALLQKLSPFSTENGVTEANACKKMRLS